jgi:hypothetical protein
MGIKYFIDYQFMPKGAARPVDDGEIVGLAVTDKDGVALLPNVGDYIQIDNSAGGSKRSSFDGRVRTRLFRYIRTSETDVGCQVNIVVEEVADDDNVWGELVKE